MNARELLVAKVWRDILVLVSSIVGAGTALVIFSMYGSIVIWAALGLFLGSVYYAGKRITRNLKKLVDTK